jgi:Flp pilus assembly pilin Flp
MRRNSSAASRAARSILTTSVPRRRPGGKKRDIYCLSQNRRGGMGDAMLHVIARCLRDESGGECLEYAILVGLIVLGCIGFVGTLGIRVADKWNQISQAMDY